VSADAGLDGRSSRISGSVVTGRCSLCNEPIMAAKVAISPIAAVVYVEVCPADEATGYLDNESRWHQGTPPAWATTVARSHACFTPAAPPPPAMKAAAATKAPAKKAPAKTRKKDSP
jgi:hypothetical protein